MDGSTQLFVNQKIIDVGYSHIVNPIFNEIYDFIMKNPKTPIENRYDPLFVATLLRYVFYFRIYLPQKDLPIIVKLCTDMETETTQLANVIFITVAGFLSIRHGNFSQYRDFIQFFNGENLKDLAVGIFSMVYRYDQKFK